MPNAEYGAYDGPPPCRSELKIETVVTTTYRLVCPIHGVVAVNLSLKEATEMTRCMCAGLERSVSDGH